MSSSSSSADRSANAPATYKWEIDNFINITYLKYAPEVFFAPNSSALFDLWLEPKFSIYKTHTVVALSLSGGINVPLSVQYQLSILGANDFTVEFTNKSTIDTQYNLNWDYLTNPANGLLVNGKLTLYCEVYVLKQVLPTVDSKISQDYGSMLENGKFSDVSLFVDKKEFKAHKLVLAARSAVFCAMFEHCDTKESQESRVDIEDMSVEVFELLLRFIYTGKVDSLDEYATELLEAADRYQLDSLKATCEQYLCASLTVESFASVAVIADMHGAKKLEKQCIDYLIGHAKEVTKTDGWKNLVESRPKLGCQLFQFVIDKI